jgi:protein gp37
MKNSKIEWTHHTFNPWWGCSKVSAACTHCYAETFAKRTGHDVWGPGKPRRFFGPNHWEQPIKWDEAAAKAGERQRVFCASMADVFEDYLGPDRDTLIDTRRALFNLIKQTPNLDWLLLTKRPENVLQMTPAWVLHFFPENIWVGTTVENQEQAKKRIPELLKIPANVRFLSCEPLLGEVNLTEQTIFGSKNLLDEPIQTNVGRTKTGAIKKGVHWIICGGESGPGARPMHPQWARSLRDQCQAANVPFFFKQWGEWASICAGLNDSADWEGMTLKRVGKARAGRLLDGKEWNEFPQR